MSFQPRRILVATDFSDFSRKAADLAVDLARTYHATIELTHVIPFARGVAAALSLHDTRPEVFAFERSMRRHALTALATEETRLRELGVEVKPHLLEGPTHAALIAASREADLVVIATHGRGGISRLALGSVAESVVRGSYAPVLTVRADAR
ncbi:MAG: universal stress protein [Deltaproteobacteria bacterium]|nr:universal stress protein [Deltaproteobacteria bacterium]